jgi:DNA-binding NarL/FixJ family response regulator
MRLELRRSSPHAKIVAMSGAGPVCDADFLTMALRLGADAAIAKPFAADKLAGILCDLLASEHPSAEKVLAA